MGGNGLKPQTPVYWNVFDQNGTPLGNSQVLLVGSNCVANQKTILVRNLRKGFRYTLKANYTANNTGKVITDQVHIRVQIF